MSVEIEKKKVAGKKKATNSFKTYIHKVLRQVHPDSQIASDAIEQLDEFIKILARKLAESSRSACLSVNKSTVGQSEIILSTNLHIPGCLATHAVEEIEKACNKFHQKKETEEKPQSKRNPPVRRETQAGLVFSVALSEKFIREFGASDLNVAKNASVALAAVLEYITAEILESAGSMSHEHRKVIIIVRHIYLAIENDEELSNLFKNLSIEFLGGGVTPNIRNELVPTKAKRAAQAARRRKNKKSPKSQDGEEHKKPHKYLPGTKALMEIRKYQKSTELLLRKLPFQRAVREIAEALNEQSVPKLKDVHFGGGSMEVLQRFVEQRVVTLCSRAVQLAIHGKRDGVNGEDIKLAWQLTEPLVIFSEIPINEVGVNGIERLAFRGGVKRKGRGMYEMIKYFMYSLVKMLLFRSLQFVKYRKVITIGVNDMKNGFLSLGINLTVPAAMGKPKPKKKSKLEPEDPDGDVAEEIVFVEGQIEE